MIKPLLRTIPTLSGNIKLVCTLLDYKQNGDVIETNIRGAKMMPISSNLFQKSLVANLLNSSWEYDVKKFYIWYSDYFYNSNYQINKTEMEILDITSNVTYRNTDFEYGFKRISYQKSGCQYACYAPIYIEGPEDIPSYFMIHAELSNGRRHKAIDIKVNIGSNKDNKENYIWHYINRYVNRINNDVAYMDANDKTVTYYGIDVVNGGFTKKIDTTVANIYNVELPIQMFDTALSDGYRRNKMCISQVLPLCFNFNIYDLLSDNDKIYYKNCDIVFSGAYYDKEGNKLDMYDFSWDYDYFPEKRMMMNPFTGILEQTSGKVHNVMDSEFPALHDKRIIDYQFSNKLTAVYNRWKLKYSDDRYPYIMNMSWAFSNNQDSNYKYKEFPVKFINQSGLAVINKMNKYTLILPIGEDRTIYNEYNPESTKKYKDILNNYCLNWFDVVNIGEDDSWMDSAHWEDTDDGHVYVNGILYDLNNIYNKYHNNKTKIDKFGVFVYPDTSKIVGSDDNKGVDNMIIVSHVVNDSISEIEALDYKKHKNTSYDEKVIFEKTDNKYGQGQDYYINVKDTDKTWYDINKYYALEEIHDTYYDYIKSQLWSKIDDCIKIYMNTEDDLDISALTNSVVEHISEEGYMLLPIYRNSLIFDNNGELDKSYKEYVNNFYISTDNKTIKPLIDGSNVQTMNTDNVYKTLRNPLYIKLHFLKDSYISPDNEFSIKKYNDANIISIIETVQTSSSASGIIAVEQLKQPGTNNTKTLYDNLVNSIQGVINDDIYKTLKNDINENSTIFEYRPLGMYNKRQYAENIFIRRNTSFGNNSGSDITSDTDFDFLWVHSYNLNNFLDRDASASIERLGKDFYARISSIDHLNVFLSKIKGGSEIIDGDTRIYKQFKVIDATNKINNINPVKYKYEELNTDNGISDIKYDAEYDMFFTSTNDSKEYFNIVEKTTFYPITKEIWDFTNIDKDNEAYKDLLVYRPWRPEEHDEKYYGHISIAEQEFNGTECDGILTPCFNIVYVQDKKDTLIYKNWILDNIKEVSYKVDESNNKRYRYASDDETYFIKVGDNTVINGKQLYIKRNKDEISYLYEYENHDETHDELKYYDDFNINTITKDGITYGYILIKVDMDITSDVLDLRGFIDSSYYDNITMTTNRDEISTLPYVKYINNVDIIETPDYIRDKFKNIAPFIRTNLLRHISDMPIIIKPTVFDLNILYRTSIVDNTNGSDEVRLIFDKNNGQLQKNQVLQRYANAIVPYIPKVSSIKNQYMKKFKDSNMTILETGRFNSIGDSPIYKETQYIDYPIHVRLYSDKDNYDIETPYEYKHYNHSVLINTNPILEVNHNNFVTYDELQELESNGATLNAFKSLFRITDEDRILFLYKKYKVLYDSTPVKLNQSRTEKLYSLTYKFILL